MHMTTEGWALVMLVIPWLVIIPLWIYLAVKHRNDRW